MNLRIGIVLSRNGGALKQMLLPFRLGLGGRIGNGRQWWSWIHIDDLVAAVGHILEGVEERAPSQVVSWTPPDRLNAPVNLVSPNPVTNAEFTQTLARTLNRPAVLPIPTFAARLAFGDLADEGLLSSARVRPEKLVAAGFKFQFPNLAEALGRLLQVER